MRAPEARAKILSVFSTKLKYTAAEAVKHSNCCSLKVQLIIFMFIPHSQHILRILNVSAEGASKNLVGITS